MSRAKRFTHLLFSCLIVLAVVLPLSRTSAAGPPIYPDLVTPTPASLKISREWLNGAYHYLLRFDNTVVNQGGRLELTANLAVSRDVYQNVYDQKIGGNRVIHTRVSTDLIFHPQHNHFHFEGIASYDLLKKNSTGRYLHTQLRGTKTSYCIIDYVRISSSARTSPEYQYCNASVQGLSAGWGDLYYASLPDQWIDLGTTMLPDGDYALQSTANPQKKIKESDTTNNTGVKYFSIRNGALSTTGQTPACTATPTTVQVGDTVQLSCTRITMGTTVDIRWRSTGGPILTTVVSGEEHKALASVVIPEASSGAYPIFAVVRSTGSYYGAVVNVGASVQLSQSTGSPGGSLGFLARGFTGGEPVSIRVDGQQVALRSASIDGTAAGTFIVPDVAGGVHTVSAVGTITNVSVSTQMTVGPSIRLDPGFAHVETAVAPILAGFASNEQVDLAVQGGSVLRTAQTSASGSASGSTTSFTLPASVTAGTVTIVATGKSSGKQASAQLLVLGAGENTPTPTATATSTPTDTPRLDTRRVTTALNMRSGAGTSFGIVRVLSSGTVVTVTGSGTSAGGLVWLPIRLQDGTTGWVAEKYLVQVVVTPPAATSTRTATPDGNSQPDTRRVTTALNMRSGAGTSYSVVRVLSSGTMVTVTGAAQTVAGAAWVPIRLQDATTGWVSERYLTRVSVTATATARTSVTAVAQSVQVRTALNLRSGPGTTYASVQILSAGTQLTVTGPSQRGGSYTWLPVRTSSGVTGWVASNYVSGVSAIALETETPTTTVTGSLGEAVTSDPTEAAPASPVRLDDAVLRWLPEIQSASQSTGLPADVLAAVIWYSSGGDAGLVSANGSIGLMQLTGAEFDALGIGGGRHDPATNISTGALLLAALRNSTGSIEGALAAYYGDGCSPDSVCASGFVTAVLTQAAAYQPLLSDPGAATVGQLPPGWTLSVTPYQSDRFSRPFIAESASEPPAATSTAADESLPAPPAEAEDEEAPPVEPEPEGSPEM
ncbi:MAG: SH3 domain-containing protein [Thermomicrobiales bacterium]|nr:SH3 domain-containing protein [Thermomicrobiales bacterium]